MKILSKKQMKALMCMNTWYERWRYTQVMTCR